jgi:hypothetical protein
MKEKSGKSQKSKTSTEKSKTIRRAEPTGFDFEQAGRAFKALKKYEKKIERIAINVIVGRKWTKIGIILR